jgi:Glycosyl hydrolase family 63 C-terminal domain
VEAEKQRLWEAERREKHWRRWGPYLSERAWGTVREDYSPDGRAWDFFPFEHSHLRAYRWGEDGIAGISDNHQRLCFALAFWNGRDPILKERLFGLNGWQGNHGEDVKECYYYLDSTPTHSYMKCLYKYPQSEFPYEQLIRVNRERSRKELEYELVDTGIFNENRYFDIVTEYAKPAEEDIIVRITITNHGPEAAHLHVLPTLWFRNTWSWKDKARRPSLAKVADDVIEVNEESLGVYHMTLEGNPQLLFTENDTNAHELWGLGDGKGYSKDAFHRRVVHGQEDAVNPKQCGTKAAAWYQLDIAPGKSEVIRLRLTKASELSGLVHDLDGMIARRIAEADEFYSFAPATLSPDARNVQRQALAGLLWSKQFYHFVVETWLKGDPAQPKPPDSRYGGRNAQWVHLYNEDIVSMPDKWEYPWYAAWDLAFHTIPLSLVDPEFAKNQLGLLLREWYMHPNGQIPAYEWAFSDVNPPVHAWACWRVFQIDRKLWKRPDFAFLESVFHKLLLNFTWWVNRKDAGGNNIFEGGFLGLDNIGVFDRSAPLPTGGFIEQSDGTSWMAMFCLNMLKIALELASQVDPIYEDIASKFFEHFLYIAAAMNGLGGQGLWDETDGFFYDRLNVNGQSTAMKLRSMVGLIPLFAVDTIEPEVIERLPSFRRRMEWFIKHRNDLCCNIASLSHEGKESRRLLSLLVRGRLTRVLEKMLDETEFLSPHGIRAVSKYHERQPFLMPYADHDYRVDYEPAESTTAIFGGNSNWRGPVWFPVNFLLIESLQKYSFYFGEDLKVEFPTGSGRHLDLWDVAAELSRRMSRIFLKDKENGRRPVWGGTEKFQTDPNFGDHVWFYEYFHGDNGAGIGASHQTGWTALVAKLLQQSGE